MLTMGCINGTLLWASKCGSISGLYGGFYYGELCPKGSIWMGLTMGKPPCWVVLQGSTMGWFWLTHGLYPSALIRALALSKPQNTVKYMGPYQRALKLMASIVGFYYSPGCEGYHGWALLQPLCSLCCRLLYMSSLMGSMVCS